MYRALPFVLLGTLGLGLLTYLFQRRNAQNTRKAKTEVTQLNEFRCVAEPIKTKQVESEGPAEPYKTSVKVKSLGNCIGYGNSGTARGRLLCGICLTHEGIVALPCGHIFCLRCMRELILHGTQTTCCDCREDIPADVLDGLRRRLLS